MSWSTSTRRSRLPADWPARRQRVLIRDRHRCVQCGARATDVDHIEPGDNHDLDNLQSLCDPCHTAKTQAEATAARQAKRPSTIRRPQPHPGLRRG